MLGLYSRIVEMSNAVPITMRQPKKPFSGLTGELRKE